MDDNEKIEAIVKKILEGTDKEVCFILPVNLSLEIKVIVRTLTKHIVKNLLKELLPKTQGD